MSSASKDVQSLIDWLGGQDIRILIRSQPQDVQRTITRRLKALLVETDQGATQPCITSNDNSLAETHILAPFIPGSGLIRYLKQYRKPQHFTRAHPGKAPPQKERQTRWICSLCPNNKQIKTRTNDLRRHLEEGHSCTRDELDLVFNPKDPARLWEYFGPCTEQQAFDNGWDVRSFRNCKNKQAASKKRISEVRASGSKGMHNMMKAMRKRVGGTSDSDLASSMESLKLQDVQCATIMTTNISGSTAVPQTDRSSTTGTYHSILHDVSSNWQPHDNAQQPIEQHDHMADSAGFGKQFDNTSSDACPWRSTTADIGLTSDNEWNGATIQQIMQHVNERPYPTNTVKGMLNSSTYAPTSNSQPTSEYHDFEEINMGDIEPDTFHQLFVEQMQS
ncbi:hypothetical protein H2198_010135 [Neophaeococcomyces mojaviensis]|uniref:Uncharacterized protein n=1 Tax=Neophaeococcomyces mojaviensis TaxID=3383035 RepID=A0ACC2ZSH2_9EURO|nr:hypothetical protein H2198_010135 [Knufia sp. JES_112]